jgi:hypothetical protein
VRQDLIFEAVAGALGVPLDQVPRGKAARGPWNAAVRDLKAEGATPGEVLATAAAIRKEWPDATLTPTSLAKHFPQFRASLAKSRVLSQACEECGIGSGLHLDDCSRRAG